MKRTMNLAARQRMGLLLVPLFLSLGTLTVTAQTLTVLHGFTALSNSTNSDGAKPQSTLVLSGNALYGTTYSGGIFGYGTIFAVNTDGTGNTNLHNFTGGTNGANPRYGLILSGTTLYGATIGGNGTVFSMNTDGTSFTTLHSFTALDVHEQTNTDGASPAGLVLSGGILYGTAGSGGTQRGGTLFAVSTNGANFTNLYNFTRGTDGGYPTHSLIISSNTLYGATSFGGSFDNGMLFAINTDGTGFTNLHNFPALVSLNPATNSDGFSVYGNFVLSGNSLYGAARDGGIFGQGTAFKINTDGSGFTNLHNFLALSVYLTNSTGSRPYGGFVLSGDKLYGATSYGGAYGNSGTLFKMNTDGADFTTLYNFTFLRTLAQTNAEGGFPLAELVLSGNKLYGTARDGSVSGNGTAFSFSLPPPQLTIIRSAENIVLSWSSSAADFILQSTTNFPSANWSAVVQSPSIVGDQFCVTNSPSGSTLFYRLRGN